jgi:hypothetical protein
MSSERNHYTLEERVAILRRHLIDRRRRTRGLRSSAALRLGILPFRHRRKSVFAGRPES